MENEIKKITIIIIKNLSMEFRLKKKILKMFTFGVS